MIPVVSAPQYALQRLDRSHQPPGSRPYDEYRECLRLEFLFSCTYCLSTEREVGPTSDFAGFEIEHFRPQGLRRFKYLKNHYPNLLWACAACNRAKGEVWPVPQEEKLGMRFVDPCAEPLGAHLEFDGDTVKPLTPAGRYVIDEINLNSAQHIERRRLRRDRLKQFAMIEAACEAIRQKAAGAANQNEIDIELGKLRAELQAIQAQFERSAPPWDHPSHCRCAQKVIRPQRLTRRERREQRLKEIRRQQAAKKQSTTK